MSTQITLNVPTGFIAHPLLAANNMEDNALILNAGCRVLVESRDASADLNQADISARLEAKAERTIAAALAEHQKAMEALKADVERQTRAAADEKALLLKAKAESEADLKKQLVTARSDTEAASTKAAAAAAAIASARAEGQADADKAAYALMESLKAAVAEAKKEALEKAQAAVAAQQRLLEAEKAAAARAAASLAEAHAEAAKRLADALALKDSEAAKERERLAGDLRKAQETFHAALTRQVGSSTKGADNEQALTKVVQRAFAASSTYMEHPKKLESGDLLFTIEGLNVMTEGKNYAKTVPQAEVLKAQRDMANNPEYDVLLFVSEHSDISGHVKPGNTDICIVEGKPSAFISNFAQQSDKVAHLQMVVSTLMAFCRLQQSVSVADADAVEAKQHKIEDMLRLFRESSADMDGLLKSMKFARRQMDVAWDTFAGEIRDKVAAFKRRLTEVQSDGVAAEVAASECDGLPPAKRANTVVFKGPALIAEAKRVGIKNIKSKSADQLRAAIAAL